MVVDVAENISLSARISAQAFKFVRTIGEWGDDLGIGLLEPVVGLPSQGDEDAPHLFSQKYNLFTPTSLPCISLRPLMTEFWLWSQRQRTQSNRSKEICQPSPCSSCPAWSSKLPRSEPLQIHETVLFPSGMVLLLRRDLA